MRKLGPRAYEAYSTLRSEIVAGRWKSGSRLPNQAELATLLHVAPLTLRQALDRLEREGMIRRHSRRGSYVERNSAVPVPGLDEMFDLMFEHAPIGVSALDMSGCLLRSNHALQSILGYPAGELEGKLMREYTHPEDAELQSKIIADAIQHGRRFYEMEKRYIRKDGFVVWCRLIAQTMMLNGREVGALGLIEPLPARPVE